MEDKRLIGALILLLMVPSFGFSETSIETFPQSKIVNQDPLSSTQSFELISGPVKRINSLLSPESKVLVEAKKLSKTLLSDDRRNAKSVFQYYQSQLETDAEVIFQCSGRSCGPSTYWANIVYKNALLYGPEQYQHYILARIGASQPYHLAIYIGQRATGQVYVQHDVFLAELPKANESLMKSALAEVGRYVLPQVLDAKLIGLIENIVAGSDAQYLLVVHDKIGEGETFDQALSRTGELAMSLREIFNSEEVLSRLRFHGAGPISPGQPPGRIEFIKL